MTLTHWRLCRLDTAHWRQSLSSIRCESVVRHLVQYLQIKRDNPNLIWLYTLMLQNEVNLPHGEVVSAMKKRLLEEEGLTPVAWRYIANGTADDFRVALDSQDPGETPKWQWKILVYWLQILSGLKRALPVPEPIQRLFRNDSLLVTPEDGEVHFQGAWMKWNTLRHILAEADNQLAAGRLEVFAETELVEVITWLASTDPRLDNNQTRTGWKYLTRKAAEWKADIVRMDAYRGLKWNSGPPRIQVERWIVEPVTDAWSLHRLAISQHHCGHRYIEDCVAGSERIFVIRTPKGNIDATLRLTLLDGSWDVGDVRGFANSEVSIEITRLGKVLAKYYTDIWCWLY